MDVADSVDELRRKIENTRKNSGMSSGTVTLLGASKGQSAETIIRAIEAGVADFGENRVQEAQEKWPELKKNYPHLRLHLIGPLQTNKVKAAVALFDVIQTVDRPQLADALAAEMRKCGKSIPCFIQVNIGEEPQKSGVAPADAQALVEYCRSQLQLPVVGLMCVPPEDKPAAPYFALLRAMAVRFGLPQLSMGMSDDFETAVRMGATCVRLGRVLFGDRKTAA